MPWSGLIKILDRSHTAEALYKSLILRVEDTEDCGWLARLYDGRTVIAEAVAEGPQQAVAEVIELARKHLNDNSITADSLAWVQTLS